MMMMLMYCIDDKHLDNGDDSGVPTVYMAKGMNILILINVIIVTNPITKVCLHVAFVHAAINPLLFLLLQVL